MRRDPGLLKMKVYFTIAALALGFALRSRQNLDPEAPQEYSKSLACFSIGLLFFYLGIKSASDSIQNITFPSNHPSPQTPELKPEPKEEPDDDPKLGLDLSR